jgi:hypothetical protein
LFRRFVQFSFNLSSFVFLFRDNIFQLTKRKQMTMTRRDRYTANSCFSFWYLTLVFNLVSSCLNRWRVPSNAPNIRLLRSLPLLSWRCSARTSSRDFSLAEETIVEWS